METLRRDNFMEKNYLEYKGYYTRIEFSPEDKVLFGKIEGINDLVNFESDSANEIENEFHAAVDDYLEFCSDAGLIPDKPYKGTFNVRVTPELHRSAAIAAFKKNISLNEFVKLAMESYISNSKYNLNVAIFQSEAASSKIAKYNDIYLKQIENSTKDFVKTFASSFVN